MAFNIDRALTRPKTWNELLNRADGAKGTLARAVRKSTIIHTELNVYSKRGWFSDLGDKWTMKDVTTHIVITFNQMRLVSWVQEEREPESIRKVADALERAAGQLQNFVVELRRRADAITLEAYAKESLEETEATD